jgi:hypothetical protein
MAYEQNPYNIKLSLVADPGLAAITNQYFSQPMTQYSFVKLGTSNSATNPGPTASVTACTATTDRPLGVLQNSPRVRYSMSQSGVIEGQEEAEITISGICKVLAGGTIAPGNVIGISATGLAVAITVGTDTTKYILGTALSAGVSGDVITIAVDCSNTGRAA